MARRGEESFAEVVNSAIRDFSENGYDSEQRFETWRQRLLSALKRSMKSPEAMDRIMREALVKIYRQQVGEGGLFKRHDGLERFTIERIKPKLRAELDRRVMASAQLIRLNRDQAIAETMRRFAGWATSIPPGGVKGSKAAQSKGARETVKKSLQSMSYVDRRVRIDQGHKLIAAIDDIVAVDAGAIAAGWHSNFRQPGYDARPEHEHRDRDGLIYLIRGSWAQEGGLVKAGAAGYSDQIDQPGFKIFCRCRFRFLYALRLLPPDMLTRKGAEDLAVLQKRKAA